MKIPFFLARNVFKSFGVPVIKPSRSGNHLFFGLTSTSYRDFSLLLSRVEGSPVVTPSTWLLYRVLGKRMIFLSKDTSPNTVSPAISALNIYYFNNFDAAQGLNTVHEAFVGVHKNSRGQGLATAIRQVAYEHFKQSALAGITTRIKKCNQASLSSAEKLGFMAMPSVQGHKETEGELYLIRPL